MQGMHCVRIELARLFLEVVLVCVVIGSQPGVIPVCKVLSLRKEKNPPNNLKNYVYQSLCGDDLDAFRYNHMLIPGAHWEFGFLGPRVDK